jgi:hypothetical protein
MADQPRVLHRSADRFGKPAPNQPAHGPCIKCSFLLTDVERETRNPDIKALREYLANNQHRYETLCFLHNPGEKGRQGLATWLKKMCPHARTENMAMDRWDPMSRVVATWVRIIVSYATLDGSSISLWHSNMIKNSHQFHSIQGISNTLAVFHHQRMDLACGQRVPSLSEGYGYATRSKTHQFLNGGKKMRTKLTRSPWLSPAHSAHCLRLQVVMLRTDDGKSN